MGEHSDTDPFVPARERPVLDRALPVSARLREYRAHTAGHDLIAGLTVAALALPSAMAYAELAGLSPVVGLYALLLPTIAYALLASGRRVSSSSAPRARCPRSSPPRFSRWRALAGADHVEVAIAR